MNYTIKINDNNPKASSIINMLKELANDYQFLNICEEDSELSEVMEKELESRYKYVIKNPDVGKSWEEVKNNLLEK